MLRFVASIPDYDAVVPQLEDGSIAPTPEFVTCDILIVDESRHYEVIGQIDVPYKIWDEAYMLDLAGDSENMPEEWKAKGGNLERYVFENYKTIRYGDRPAKAQKSIY